MEDKLRIIDRLSELASLYENIADNLCSTNFSTNFSDRKPLSDSNLRLMNIEEQELNKDFYRAFDKIGFISDSLHKRTVKRATFEECLEYAVPYYEECIARFAEAKWDLLLDKYKMGFQMLQEVIQEHKTTPYSDQPLPSRTSYLARAITSNQLKSYLAEMEKKNPSERFGGGKV